jgi:hypothetical protein
MSASAFFILVSRSCDALVDELLERPAIGFNRLDQRGVHALDGLHQQRLDIGRRQAALRGARRSRLRRRLHRVAHAFQRQLAALQGLQRGLLHGLAQRLALFGRGLRELLHQGVMVESGLAHRFVS